MDTEENRGLINKTLRFCRRCIDVVFILSSLMSTCELDRFVIQTYIKVLKSCSAPFVDRAGIGDSTTRRTPMDGRERNKHIRAWMMNLLQVRALDPCSVCQYVKERHYPCVVNTQLSLGKVFLKIEIFLLFCFVKEIKYIKKMSFHKQLKYMISALVTKVKIHFIKTKNRKKEIKSSPSTTNTQTQK